MLEELEELADEVKEIEELADEEDATPGSDCRAPGEEVQLSVRLTGAVLVVERNSAMGDAT